MTGGFDPPRWQPALDGETALFCAVTPGAAVALVGREDWDRGEGRMLEWRAAAAGRLVAARAPWRGAQFSEVDIVLVGDDDACSGIAGAGPREALRALRDGVRRWRRGPVHHQMPIRSARGGLGDSMAQAAIPQCSSDQGRRREVLTAQSQPGSVEAGSAMNGRY